MPTVRSIVARSSGDNFKLKTLIEAITASDVFQMNVAPGGPDADKHDKAKDGEKGGAGVPAQSGTASAAPAVHHAPGG
jgi:hypothetical protein